MSASNNQVIIVGGGIAGLVLAQGLKYRNIPFSLFERDSKGTTKGYRFRVVDEGLDALEETIPPSLWKLLEDTVPVSSPPHLLLLNAISGERTTYIESTNARSYPIDRRWARELLCIGIEEHLHFDKAFKHYELLSGNGDSPGVRVTFTDGTTASGRMVIGADGERSKVRRQFLPQMRLLDIERTILWGRTPLTPEFEKRFNRPDVLAEHIAAMIDPHDKRHSCFFAPIRWPHGGKISSVSSHLSDRSDYMFVALNFERPPVPLDTEEARMSYAREMTKGWNDEFKHLINELTETSAISVNSNRPDIDVWETDDRVTFMGDAIHAMSPSGGSGGLTAVLDAAALTKVLTQSWDGSNWTNLKDGFSGYEAGMRVRAKTALDYSFTGGKFLWLGKEWHEYSEVRG
jgi:2-polyprenyl-6-methoxyphenol hydroxylase-like FAD-dependent oxidoreductase